MRRYNILLLYMRLTSTKRSLTSLSVAKYMGLNYNIILKCIIFSC